MEKCDICGAATPTLIRLSDGTDSGEYDYMCDDCVEGRFPAEEE